MRCSRRSTRSFRNSANIVMLIAPIGRLTQNTTDQCTFSTRNALTAGPTTAAKPHTADIAPWMRARSAGV